MFCGTTSFRSIVLRQRWLTHDRDFSEVDLRLMLQHARGHRADIVEGRFVIETEHKLARWEVIVEPDELDHLLVVVTAYPVSP
jgi:hypothetical protein